MGNEVQLEREIATAQAYTHVVSEFHVSKVEP
jgi:hypothetical protein